MTDKRKLRLVVDEESATHMKSALGLPEIRELGKRSVEVGLDTLKDSCKTALQNVLNMVAEMPTNSNGVRISQVKFTLMANASGEVSVLSAAKGQISGTTGFEFTISIDKDEERKER